MMKKIVINPLVLAGVLSACAIESGCASVAAGSSATQESFTSPVVKQVVVPSTTLSLEEADGKQPNASDRGEEVMPPSRFKSPSRIKPCVAALIVQHHDAYGFDIPWMALTDALTTDLSGSGFRVINPYNVIGKSLNRTAEGETMPSISAMELARKVGAQCAITASVLEYNELTKGNPPVKEKYRIRLAFNVADASNGATICGAKCEPKESNEYRIAKERRNLAIYKKELLHDASAECAAMLVEKFIETGWEPPPSPQRSLTLQPPPEPLTLGDMKRALEALSDKMMSLDSRFNARHAAVAERRGGKQPVIVIGGIGDLTGGHSPCRKLANYRDLGKDYLQTRLGKSCRFEIKDPAAVEAMRPFIVDSPKDPLSDRALLEALRRHISPDFFIAGHVKYDAENCVGTYFIHLGVYDFIEGVVAWEDTFEVKKSLPKGGNK